MSFNTPEAFKVQTTEGPKEGPQTQRILKKDSILQRADHAGSTIASTEVPVFLANKESIQVYARGHPNPLSKYTLTRDVHLFEFSFPNLGALIRDPRVSTDVREFIATTYFGITDATPEMWERLRSQGWTGTGSPSRMPQIIPAQHIAPGVYTNRIFASIICRLGFDGWIAMPNTLIQRNLDVNYYRTRMEELRADIAAGTVRYLYNVQKPEVVLCDWSKSATAATMGGYRKKVRKTHRKKTRKTYRK